MKRQAMTVTIKQLMNLVKELNPQAKANSAGNGENIKFQINIINKTPEQSDTWEIESL